MKWLPPCLLFGVLFGRTRGFSNPRRSCIRIRTRGNDEYHSNRVSLLPNDNDVNKTEQTTHEQQDSNDDSSLWFSSDKTLPLSAAQESLKRYVERVKSDMIDRDFVGSRSEGVECTGEPSVDPSRQVQSQGDSEWMDDW